MAGVTGQKAQRGRMSYHAGLAAECQIAWDYVRRGYRVAGHRWRGDAGEIDLITRDDDGVVFVEVKKSKDFATAARALSRAQMQRLYRSAEQFLGGEPKGQLTNARFDVALVDASGNFEIIENAFGGF